MEIKEQQLVEIKSQVSIVQQSANALVVEDKKSMSLATDLLHNVSQAEKYVIERKEEVTKPLMGALAKVRDLFRPMESNLADAKKIIKSKMLEFSILESDRIEKEQQRIAKRVEKGLMRADTAAGKLETLGESSAPVEGESGKSSIRDVKKIRIVDETAIPREYMTPNMPLITEAIIRKGLTISGVEMYVEKIIVSRSRHDNPNLQ